MTIKTFYVDALGGALELGLGTPDDILRHVTPDVLAKCLPRPLWARLLTACLGSPNINAQLVVDTIGVANLCEHVPTSIIWECIAEIGARALGQSYVVAAAPAVAVAVARASAPLMSPPPDAAPSVSTGVPVATGPSIPAPVNQPLADLITELEQDDRPITPTRPRTATAQRFRPSSTGINRPGGPQPPATRRPQAVAVVPQPTAVGTTPRTARRNAATDVSPEVETETAVDGAADWHEAIAVEDSQLVDWQSAEETITNSDDYRRKR